MFLQSLQGYVTETGMVQLNLMPGKNEGELIVVIQGRAPKDGVAELYPTLTFEGEVNELEAGLAGKITEFMGKRAEVKTDLDSALEQMKQAAAAKKEQEAEKAKSKTKKPAEAKATEAKKAAPAEQSSSSASMGLFDEIGSGEASSTTASPAEATQGASAEATFVTGDDVQQTGDDE